MKMLTLFLVLFIHLAHDGISQHILLLKNGDSINGLVEKVENDKIYFKFQGNNLSFDVDDVSAIYFDKDAYAKEAQVLSSKEKRRSVIRGVVTFYFNQNFKDKPDVGAKVYILKEDDASDICFNTLDSIYEASQWYDSYRQVNDRGGSVSESMMKRVTKYRFDSPGYYEALDRRAMSHVAKFTLSPVISNGISRTVDGNGNYSIEVDPGTYYVLIVSNNRHGRSISMSGGKFIYKKISINEGEEIDFSTNFSL